ALSSLAGYAYEHPSDPFPEIADDGRTFSAEGLGHPLLPAAKCVRNDLRLDDDLRLIVISGSNMSGKSTLMRAVGVNTVLALAGAPVRAQSLRVSPLAIGASIRIQDSLQEGISHFYAEILRLRQVVELSRGALPLLFLLDEILHGTNSHDRLIGAEAVVRSLVANGAIGLVSTHDLALARIVDDPALRAINAHFEDQIVEGKMQFDYHLRPGVVQKSNALELMRSVGLDV
ncbi:MAG: MutS-related protein, partial [Actinomycetota bacterium]